VIPAEFSYRQVTSLDEAVDALAGSDGSAKVIAGGMSLLPLMKLRLASADSLIDIGRLGQLRGALATSDGGYEVGALTTYAELRDATSLDWVKEAIDDIGDIQVRNRGTVGGAIAHCDPASDLPAIGLALDYSAVLRSTRGERVVALDGFFQGAFQTAMESDEILVALRRGPLPAGASGAYAKLAQPASGYSIVGVAAVVARGADGRISHARVALTGAHEHPYRAPEVESALVGSAGTAEDIRAAAAHATDEVEVNRDIHADRAYRTEMAAVYTRRAIEAALGRSA
jgi:carbon-monoxide dehydrogenase medium subunit